MHFIDVLSLSLSFLGIYSFVFSLRYLIPCYNIRLLSEVLNETQQLLNHAETMDAISSESEYKTDLDRYEDYVVIPIASPLILYIDVARRTNLRSCAGRVIVPRGLSSNCALLLSVA